MESLSNYIHQFVCINIKKLGLHNNIFDHKFNHCTILNYHAGLNMKKKSHMGYHCDFKYNLKGEYEQTKNSQVENTPTIVISTGQSRKLNWRRFKRGYNKKGNIDWIVDKSWKKQMLMDQSHMLVLNPLDEKPHIYQHGDMIVKYQHGNVSVVGHSMSFAFVFRVVDEYCDYNPLTNAMITPTTVLNEKEMKNKIIINQLYKSFDMIEYHIKMQKLYNDTLKITKFHNI